MAETTTELALDGELAAERRSNFWERIAHKRDEDGADDGAAVAVPLGVRLKALIAQVRHAVLETPRSRMAAMMLVLAVLVTVPFTIEFHPPRTAEALASQLARRSVVRQAKAEIPDDIAAVDGTDLATLTQSPAYKDCRDCAVMRDLPAGELLMGSDDEEDGRLTNEGPRHRVRIKPFAMSVTEITVAQFAAFVVDTGYRPAAGCLGWDGVQFGMSERLSWSNPGFVQSDEQPAVCLGWEDARAYVAWLGGKTGRPYRLPSEAEWEYAARAGTRGAQYWERARERSTCAYANVVDRSFKSGVPGTAEWKHFGCNDGAARTARVGSYLPNAFGLFDMIGNVWEWVDDCWHDSYLGAPSDGSVWRAPDCHLHVQRGGSWGDSVLTTARATARSNDAIAPRSVYSGFRVALDR